MCFSSHCGLQAHMVTVIFMSISSLRTCDVEIPDRKVFSLFPISSCRCEQAPAVRAFGPSSSAVRVTTCLCSGLVQD